MSTEPLPEGKIYKRELITGIWIIMPCQLRYEMKEKKAIVMVDKEEDIYSMEDFQKLCEQGVYAKDPKKVYDSVMKLIRNDS